MMGVDWTLAEAAAQLLERDERDAVMGDLEEAGESAWSGLLGVLGLLVRRQMMLWKNWRPWIAAFGLAAPASFLLMGFSLSVSLSLVQFASPKASTNALTASTGLMLMCHVFLLIAWSWTGGFVVGSLSRRTLWVSIASAFLPCLFCLSRFRVPDMPRLSLLLFVVPAIWGVHRGLKTARIEMPAAIVLALAVTLMMIPAWGGGRSMLNWLLVWPAWYMLAIALKTGQEAGPG
jgi:hypothetical protein